MTALIEFSIVQSIEQVETVNDLRVIGDHIKKTYIPSNHDEIAHAWEKKRRKLALEWDWNVARHIERQKAEHPRTIDLVALRSEVARLHALLNETTSIYLSGEVVMHLANICRIIGLRP